MASVLLFNIDEQKLAKIRAVAESLFIDCIVVKKEDFTRTLAELTARSPKERDSGEIAELPGEMLIMDSLSGESFHAFLDGLRREAPVALKAVVTEHNLSWRASELYFELVREHLEMQRLAQKR